MKKMTKRIVSSVFGMALAFTVGAGVYSASVTADAEGAAITIADAVLEGDVYKVAISCADWTIATSDPVNNKDTFDINYTTEDRIECRRNILINDKSLFEIQDTVDDSGYVYTMHPMTVAMSQQAYDKQYDVFQNPAILAAEVGGNTVVVWIHKTYVDSICTEVGDTFSVTIKTGFNYNGTTVAEEASKVVYTKEEEPEVIPPTILDTTVSSIDGTYEQEDKFLSFYLGESDYANLGSTVPVDKAWLASLNFYNYIELDGKKLPEYAGYMGEVYYNVWGRTGSFSIRWPEEIKAVANDVQEIKILVGCQFPAGAENTIYEVKEEQTFLRQESGEFVDPNAKEPEVIPPTIYETTVSSIDGTYAKDDKFLSFYLSENDYAPLGDTASVDKAWLASINFYDYIELDGKKLSEYAGYMGEVYYNVWNRIGSFSTRWPESLVVKDDEGNVIEDLRNGIQEIKILAGCQFPAAKENTIYEVTEEQVFLRQASGEFADVESLLSKEDVKVTMAEVAGSAQELYKVSIQGKGWLFTSNLYDYNYSGYISMSNFLKLNGVGIYDINKNTDDSAYVYSTYPSLMKDEEGNVLPPMMDPNTDQYPDRELFTNPVLMEAPIDGDTMNLYIHKDYVDSLCKNFGDQLILTICVGYGQSGKIVNEEINVVVYEIGYDLVLMDGETELMKLSKAAGTELVDLPAPEAKEHYTFIGWVDAEGNPAPATMPAEVVTLYAAWAPVAYTATVVYLDGTQTVVTFGAEKDEANGILYTADEMKAAINACLPEETETTAYGYVERVPNTFELKDYIFTVQTVQNVFTITFVDESGNDLGIEPITFTAKTINDIVLPAVPQKDGYTGAWDKTVDRLKLEDVTLKAVYTEIKEVPSTPDVPQDSTDSTDSTDSSDDSVDAPADNGGILAKLGCASVVGSVAGGLTALAIATVALLKKKED